MNTLSATTSLLAHSLVWALLYSLWQGLLLFAVLYVVLRAMPLANARVKYYLGIGTLGALFVWFADTWASQYERLKGITVYITQAGADGALGASYQVKQIAGNGLHAPELSHLLSSLEGYFPALMVVYIAGLAFMLMRFAVNIWRVNMLRKRGLVAPEPYWTDMVQQWQSNFEIARPVQLFLSRSIDTPMMLGAVKPIILLPIAAINHLSTKQLEAILLHELAHIKRHDYLINLLQVVVETVLFFNPFVWFISRIVRREREHCCDDMVVAHAHDPLPYASALALLEEQRITATGLTLAATGNKHQLFNRIKRIMEMKKTNVNYSKLTIIIVAILAITFTGAMLTSAPSVAQTVKTDTLYAPIKTVHKTKTVIIDENGNKTVTKQKTTTPIAGKDVDDDDAPVVKHSVIRTDHNTSTDEDIARVIEDVKKIAGDAIASIDFKEIEKEVDDATREVNDVDWKAVRAEISKGLAEVDKQLNDPELSKKINKEVKKALKESKKAMEESMASIPPAPPTRPAYSHAATPPPPVPPAPFMSKEEGHNKSAGYQPMIKEMADQGLVDDNEYKIEAKNGSLYINGEKQSEDIYNKYAHYLGHDKVEIERHNSGPRKTIMYDSE